MIFEFAELASMRTRPRLLAITLFLLSAFGGAARPRRSAARRTSRSSLPTSSPTSPFADWTVYHIMVEMFANGNPGNDGEISGWKHPNYAGGDLQGSLEHAGYLQDLGVNASG